MTPTQTHKFLAIIPMEIEDLSGEVSENELINVVYQEVVNNIDYHKDNISVIRDIDEQSKETE